MHGGAKGSGAPQGNKNALKHGAYTREALQRRAQMRTLIQEARQALKGLGEGAIRAHSLSDWSSLSLAET